MRKIGREGGLQAEGRDAPVQGSALAGMYLAKPWLALPAIIAFPILLVVGEGDYIIVVLGVLWGALLAGAVEVRRRSQKGTTRRACATWVAFWAAVLCFSMFALALTFALDNSWR